MSSRVLAVLVGACVFGCQPVVDPDALAVFKGGSVTIADVESVVAKAPRPSGVNRGEELIDVYRGIAESIAVDRVLANRLAEGGRDAALEPAIAQELHRRVVVGAYVAARTGKNDAVTEAEITKYYQDNPEQFRRPEQKDLQMIYVRFSDERPREAADALLRELRRRAEVGESFDQLVRTYSDSETRVTDGKLGFVAAGLLDPAVEERVFPLEPGSISEPVPVAGGAAIFRVIDGIAAKEFELQEVRSQIRARLQNRALDEAVRELSDATPEGTVITESGELERLLNGADATATVLEMGERLVTVDGLKAIMRVLSGDSVEPLSSADEFSEYLAMVKREQIYRGVVESGFLDDPATLSAVDRRTDELTRQVLVSAALEREMWKRVEASRDAVQRFYESSRNRYQRPLTMWVQSLSMKAGDAPVEVAQTLGQVRAAVAAGQSTLEEEAERLGGRFEDYGPLEFEQLRRLDPKIRLALLAVNAPGLTAPFHLDGEIHVFRVADLRQPEPMEFDECAAQVRRDYFIRHHDELRSVVVSDILRQVRFIFRPEVVRRRVLMDSDSSAQ